MYAPCVHTHTHTHTRARAHTHTHTHTRARAHTHTHACTHARTHANNITYCIDNAGSDYTVSRPCMLRHQRHHHHNSPLSSTQHTSCWRSVCMCGADHICCAASCRHLVCVGSVTVHNTPSLSKVLSRYGNIGGSQCTDSGEWLRESYSCVYVCILCTCTHIQCHTLHRQ